MDAVERYRQILERENGTIENVKFCLGDRSNLAPEDVANEAFHAVAMHQTGLSKAMVSFPEPELDAVDLHALLAK